MSSASHIAWIIRVLNVTNWVILVKSLNMWRLKLVKEETLRLTISQELYCIGSIGILLLNSICFLTWNS